ncbi:hypothetical protein M2273_001537 [Mucilaginibacter lappiensis]|jgi:hypothetical protein
MKCADVQISDMQMMSEPGLNRLKDFSDFCKSNPKNLINLLNPSSDKMSIQAKKSKNHLHICASETA